MAGIPLFFATSNGYTRLSTFVKQASLLGSPTALVDVDGGAAGWFRIFWDDANGFSAEGTYHSEHLVVALSLGSYPIDPGRWYWVCAAMGGSEVTDHQWSLALNVTPVGTGTAMAQQLATSAATTLNLDMPVCSLAWGVPLTSTYAALPNAAGYEMTELCVETGRGTIPGFAARVMPTGPISAPVAATTEGIVALYHCDVPLGANRTVKDDSQNGYDLAPATSRLGNTIVADSPF